MGKEKDQENDDIHALVERIRKGDGEAFMAVIRRYQKKVFILAYSFFRNREDALDMVQETFLRLYQNIGAFERGKNFQGWLLQIAKNLCIDHYRKHQKKREMESEKPLEELSLSSERENRSSFHEWKEIVNCCLPQLPLRQRTVFILKHFKGLQYSEIAETLNISIGTVKSLHFKAAQNLKRLIIPYLGMEKC